MREENCAGLFFFGWQRVKKSRILRGAVCGSFSPLGMGGRNAVVYFEMVIGGVKNGEVAHN